MSGQDMGNILEVDENNVEGNPENVEMADMTENVPASVVDIEKRGNDGNEDVDESEKKKLKTDGAEVVVQVEGQGDAGNDVVQGKLEVLDTTGDQLDEFLKKPDDNVNSGVVEDATECLRQLDAAIGNELKLLGSPIKTVGTPNKFRTPVRGDATPKKGDTTPVRGDATPKKGDTTPKKGDTTPKNGDAIPKRGDSTPKKRTATPDLHTPSKEGERESPLKEATPARKASRQSSLQ